MSNLNAIFSFCCTGVHRGVDDQVDAVCDQHIHRQLGPGRLPRPLVLRPSQRHMGCHQHLAIWLHGLQIRHLLTGMI